MLGCGLNWTYEYLCEYTPILTRCALLPETSLPMNVADLNPIIKRLLTTCPGSTIYGASPHSVVLSITDNIVAKVCLVPGDQHLSYEQSIFKLLDQTPSPHIVQSFLHCPDIIFMERLNGGTLYERMTMVNISRPILQWMQQLSEAAACLESHGYVHGDINPTNILFDKDRLKLVDFDMSYKIGDDLNTGIEPYVRLRKKGEIGGTYGIAGASTEQFALGSIFWFMTRGKELYHELEGPEQLDHLMDGLFPPTDPQDPIDNIISNCWLGKFESISDVSRRVCEVVTFNENYWVRKKECEQCCRLLEIPGY